MRSLLTWSTLVAMLLLGSCSSSKKANEADSLADTPTEMNDQDGLKLELNGSSDSMSAGALSTIYFAFDSANINDAGRAILDANATYLKANADVQIQIEGHCDERGSIQYNLALGERRAQSVQDYLTALGVEASRITTISYGKEKPLDLGHDEASWSRNRRANFVITAK
jgi:peptidoglycan-associated lipoprotein